MRNLLVSLLVIAFFGLFITALNQEPNKVDSQTQYAHLGATTKEIEIVETNDSIIHFVEYGEHLYELTVWGDDFEFTDASHAEDCPCTSRANGSPGFY